MSLNSPLHLHTQSEHKALEQGAFKTVWTISLLSWQSAYDQLDLKFVPGESQTSPELVELNVPIVPHSTFSLLVKSFSLGIPGAS